MIPKHSGVVALLHDRGAAEDCVQETFARGFEKLSTYRGDSAPKAWFTAIALNVCRHRVREWKHTSVASSDYAIESGRRAGRPRPKGVASQVVQNEDLQRLAIALGFLTESQREVFILHYDQELSYEEIGSILGFRPGAARALAHRARTVLRETLETDLSVKNE